MEELYLIFYSFASSMQHLDFGGLSSQAAIAQERLEDHYFVDVAPSEQWLEQALIIAHGSVLKVIATFNEAALLGMDSEIEAATKHFKSAWKTPQPSGQFP